MANSKKTDSENQDSEKQNNDDGSSTKSLENNEKVKDSSNGNSLNSHDDIINGLNEIKKLLLNNSNEEDNSKCQQVPTPKTPVPNPPTQEEKMKQAIQPSPILELLKKIW